MSETDIIEKVKSLLESIIFDEYGVMSGVNPCSGNGGLISLETLQKADDLKKAIQVLEVSK